MDRMTEHILIEYLQVEIDKMQKTAEGLEKMIDAKNPEKDYDLIDTLQQLRSTTLSSIDNKKRELRCLYKKRIETDNN